MSQSTLAPLNITRRLLLTSLLSLYLIALNPTWARVQPGRNPTICRGIWLKKNPSKTSGNTPSMSGLAIHMSSFNRPHTQQSITVTAGNTKFTTPKGSEVVSGDSESACGKGYTDDDIVACVWNGGLDEDKLAKRPGWLSSTDQRNCGASIKVSRSGSTKTAMVRVADACPMHIPASQPEKGCQELWLTKGAFQAIGVSDEEAENNQVTLQWDFVNPPY